MDNKKIDYKEMTAACGRDCFNCPFHLAKENTEIRQGLAQKLQQDPENFVCDGCRAQGGNCKSLKALGFSGNCKIYDCVQEQQVDFCYECQLFPCNLLHPLADRADRFPHNMKVFNLCSIQRMGLEKWAQEQAPKSWHRYYNDTLDSCV